MKITFLGTSHGITEKDRFTSSTLITIGEKNYLIDAGAPIMRLLQVYGADFKSLSDVFITHSHADHYMGLLEFTHQIESFMQFDGVNVTVHAPELFPFAAMRKFLFGEGDLASSSLGGNRRGTKDSKQRIDCVNYSEGEIFNDGIIKVSAFKTMHYKDSHSLLIEAEGKKVLFTGDLRHDLLDFRWDATEGGVDLVVMEGAHQKLGTPEIIEKLKGVPTKTMLINHIYSVFNPESEIQKLTSAAKERFEVIPTYDGFSFEI